MKRNLMTVVATLAAVFFLGATIAEAADIKFGGQLRPRFEISEKNDFDDRSDADMFTNTRIRLNVSVDINDTTSAFIQMQAIGVYGARAAAFAASDGLADVGLHQAYFTLKNFFDIPVDLKFGRQEITLDGHRLIGNTGWTPGAQTHDAVRLTHSQDDLTLMYAFSKAVESTTTQAAPDDDTDINAHIFWANLGYFKDSLGGPLSLYFIALDDDSNNTADAKVTGTGAYTSGAEVDDNIYTVGFRQAGHLDQLWGIDYRGEFYYQFGDAEGDAVTGAGAGTDRGAHMFGLRVGKKFTDVAWQPTATIWYDHLSGTDDGDLASGDWSTFHTLFDTGHKYYGFMDLFLPGAGGNTAGLGLRDLAAKFSVKPPVDGLTLKADIHFFWTDVNLDSNPVQRAANGVTTGSAADDNHLGEELDLTAVYKYNPNTTIVVGYSHFFADDLFYAVNGNASNPIGSSDNDDANWAYVMFNVVF